MKANSILKCLLVLIVFLLIFLAYRFSNRLNSYKLATVTNIKVRNFIHSKQQIELTKIIKINPKQCDNLQPISVFIHSATKYHNRRQIQRNTWVSDVNKHNISVYFVVGMTVNQNVEQMIQRESKKYKDIIQFGFIDDYYNNTLKAISILRWIQKYCNQSKFILKTDDDVLVNIDLFLNNLNRFKPGIHGLLFRKVKPARDKKSRWYLPEKYYNNTQYPIYIPGAAYLMSGNIIDSLVTGIDSFLGNVIDIDDVFITGIIAKQMGIKRFYTNLVAKTDCFKKCNLFKFGAIFGCNKGNLFKKMWRNWKNSSEQSCFPKKSEQKHIN